MKQTRLKPDDRKAAAVLAGIDIAERGGLSAVSLVSVAKTQGVSASALTYHFKNKGVLVAAVVSRAVEVGRLRVVAQAVVRNHPAVAGLSAEEKGAALASFG